MAAHVAGRRGRRPLNDRAAQECDDREIYAFSPYSHWIHDTLASAYTHLDDFEKARSHFEQSVGKRP